MLTDSYLLIHAHFKLYFWKNRKRLCMCTCNYHTGYTECGQYRMKYNVLVFDTKIGTTFGDMSNKKISICNHIKYHL